MPKFVIPPGMSLSKKADLDMINVLGRFVNAGSKGLIGQNFYHRSEGAPETLEAFGLIVQKEVVNPGKPEVAKKIAKAVSKFAKAFAAAPPLKKATLVKQFQDASYGYSNSFPYKEQRWFATEAGKKLYREVEIQLGS